MGSQLSHLVLQGLNLELVSIANSQIGNMANPCSDEWPSCRNSRPRSSVYVPTFFRLQLIMNSVSKKGWAEEFYLPVICGVSTQASVISYANMFSLLYLKVTQTSCNYYLLNMQTVKKSYLCFANHFVFLFCSLTVEMAVFC